MTPEEDKQARWVPSEVQMRVALAMLKAAGDEYETVIVPLAQPGKRYGLWTTGQVVEPVPGFWLGTHGLARSEADKAALLQLGNRSGTTAYAVIFRDGHCAVFEGTSNELGT